MMGIEERQDVAGSIGDLLVSSAAAKPAPTPAYTSPKSQVAIWQDDEDYVPPPPPSRPVKGVWLDAYPRDVDDVSADPAERIAAVDADDNGLYRLFR